MSRWMMLMALVGLAVTIGLIAYNGAHAIAQSLLAVGWGIGLIAIYHLLPVACSAIGWRWVLRSEWTAAWYVFLQARLIRESVSLLLPVAQVGGEVVGARMLSLRGLKPPLAGAGVVVDLTLEAATQVVFTLIGLAVFSTLADDRHLFWWLALSAVIGGVLIGVFFWLQQHGLFTWLEALLKKIDMGSIKASLGRLDGMNDFIQMLYSQRRHMAAASSYHLACWLLGAVETWLILYFMGHSVSWADALFLESIGEAIRGAAFIIPGQLGVQEGGYMLLGQVIGLTPEVGLTLSLVKRVRILTVGLPSLVMWQIIEARSLLARP